ncbi:heme ABC transporter ATP-binding protein [Neptuniibacter sp. 1_MG-2023]|jgi:iron complex transport system ATP-binding protein|uniref:heme ABC transporter ATP-binding protein n=1 Tax=Neptuniibacter sp. 1_MG-2023 TaxID=3062662 RepID=UPI0026E24810|nr:heme ABC transporter ATP-binding protein [Neptuniibacter sp. 1_MG-2023]MDO6593562.1 heme ABC transporter ATP-binding protein [Neptuniibacter sp. 1_MG-2023]
MLQLNNVSFKPQGKLLLDQVSVSVKAGEVYGLLGPNGAGKTTLLKAISGDIKASGSIKFYGKELTQWNRRELAKHLAVLPQASQLTFPFSAREVVALGLTPLSLSKAQANCLIDEKMQATDCYSFADRSYPSLSGGERQRVQLARVLLQLSQASHSPLLLLDEPTSAQDLGQQHNLLTLTQQLAKKEGFGVVAILHDLNQVLRYCDTCCLLDQGQVSAVDSPDKVLSDERIKQHWQYQPQRVILNDGQIALI